MSIVKYEPVNLLSRMQNELNEFFLHGNDGLPSFFKDSFNLLDTDWAPNIDVNEDENHFIITADVPGVAPKDIHVSMDGGVLTIKGERKEEKEEKKKNYRRKECMSGSFERSFLLPDTADSAKVTATGKHGVLTIQVAKKAAAKPRTIEIKSQE